MRVLADPNILARLAQPAHHSHPTAFQAVQILLARGEDPCIVPQVIYEFWVVATRPVSANGPGMSVPRVESEIAKSVRIFTLMRDERAIYVHWKSLVVKHNVQGKAAHDARLVAAMKRHSLGTIITFNPGDFALYSDIIVLTPEQIVESAAGSGDSRRK